MLRKKISQYGGRNIQFRRNQEMNLILTQFSEIVDRLTQFFLISLSLPTKANDCHNHLKLKPNALFCYFLPF